MEGWGVSKSYTRDIQVHYKAGRSVECPIRSPEDLVVTRMSGQKI